MSRPPGSRRRRNGLAGLLLLLPPLSLTLSGAEPPEKPAQVSAAKAALEPIAPPLPAAIVGALQEGRYPDAIAAASWDSVIMDAGRQTLQRIPMREPLKGTRAHVEELLDACRTAGELIDRLQG